MFKLWGSLLLMAFVCTTVQVSAQVMGYTPPAPINLDSLSDDDKALLIQYKDSFDNELQGFLSIFEPAKKLRFDTTVYNMDKSSHAEVGTGFASHIYINGRDAGLNGVGFFPAIAYEQRLGFTFALVTGFYTDKVIAQAAPVPLIAPSAGFQRTVFKRWFLGITYTRTFITYGTAESEKLLNNDLNFTTAVDMWKKLIISGTVLADWSSLRPLPAVLRFEKRSYEIALSLRKEFMFYKILGAKVFTITPAINAYFATDNLAFIRALTADEQKRTNLSGFTAGIDHFFGFVDIEPTLTVDWRIRNLDIFATPALAIPFNEFDYDTNKRIVNPKEYRFYVQAGIKYLVHVNKRRKKAGSPGSGFAL